MTYTKCMTYTMKTSDFLINPAHNDAQSFTNYQALGQNGFLFGSGQHKNHRSINKSRVYGYCVMDCVGNSEFTKCEPVCGSNKNMKKKIHLASEVPSRVGWCKSTSAKWITHMKVIIKRLNAIAET